MFPAKFPSSSTPVAISATSIQNHRRSQELNSSVSSTPITTANTNLQREEAFGMRSIFFNWLTGNSNSISKLESGPVIDVTNIHDLERKDQVSIGEHLGLSEEENIKEPFIKFNEILRLSHYGKRSSEGELISENYDLLTQEQWQSALQIDKAQMGKLRKAASTIHINIAVSKDFAQEKKSILLYFLGSETKSFTDNLQLAGTAMNVVGPVYKEITGLIEVFTQILKKDSNYQLDLVSGHSLGAGVAQCFAMAIGNPRLIMLDPQLLTDKQANLVCGGADKAALFSKPHGIAITVDYDKKPSGGLMTRMKNWNFKHPGILQLQMPLKPSDGDGVIYKKDKRTAQLIAQSVVEEPRAGKFGYHGAKPDMLLFNYAIDRFVEERAIK
jgi:hypothetical protein